MFGWDVAVGIVEVALSTVDVRVSLLNTSIVSLSPIFSEACSKVLFLIAAQIVDGCYKHMVVQTPHCNEKKK